LALKAKATIRLKFNSQKQLRSLLDALKPEVNAPVTRRANVNLEKLDDLLVFCVEAQDIVALRATLNAYLRWIGSTVDVISLIEHF
jgi:tRNA threonylcarbamoyladenosine modification (KEOPS) complex  Pcc1 subunit